MTRIILWFGSVLLDFGSDVLDWIYAFIGLPTVPAWLRIASNYILSVVPSAVHLVSFIFPSQEIWISYLAFIVEVEFAVLTYKLVKFILDIYDKLKPT